MNINIYSGYYLLGLEVEIRIYKEPEYNVANIYDKYNNSVSITIIITNKNAHVIM